MLGDKRGTNLEASELQGRSLQVEKKSVWLHSLNPTLCPVAAAQLCGPLALVAPLDLM